MRVLIVEDRQALADEYLRIFGHILEGDFSYTHVPTIEAAISPLQNEQWGVIFVDNDLGPGVSHIPTLDAQVEEVKLNNGYDLIRFRRGIEDTVEGIDKSLIVGIAANQVALTFFMDMGADTSILKLHIPAMAEAIRQQA
jgi:hypothetical protein